MCQFLTVTSFVHGAHRFVIEFLTISLFIVSYGCESSKMGKMFRYIVALLLVSLYSKSSGAPTNGSGTDLSTLLTNLASTCENQFLRTQITNKVNDCHVLVPPYDEKRFQCMLFYDINKQLCAAVAASKLALLEDYTAQLQKEQDVKKLCNAAQDWSFTELGEVYKKYVSVVFNDPYRCARVCSVDNNDLLNMESNFYCKYLKWGSEMLKPQVVIAPSQAGTAVDAPVHLTAKTADTVTKNPAPLPVEASEQSSPDINVKDQVAVPKPFAPANTDASHVPAAEPASSTPVKINPEAAGNVETGAELPIPKLPVSGVALDPSPVKPDTTGSNKGVVDPNSAVSSEGAQNNPVSQIEPEKKQEATSDSIKNDAKPKETETNAEPKKVDAPINPPNNQVDKPNPNDIADPDEYQNDLGKFF